MLTGASRGIGHATGKLFSEAGWRIITCARQPFDGGRLAEDFCYASNTNDDWLSGEGLLALLDEGLPKRRRRAAD